MLNRPARHTDYLANVRRLGAGLGLETNAVARLRRQSVLRLYPLRRKFDPLTIGQNVSGVGSLDDAVASSAHRTLAATSHVSGGRGLKPPREVGARGVVTALGGLVVSLWQELSDVLGGGRAG